MLLLFKFLLRSFLESHYSDCHTNESAGQYIYHQITDTFQITSNICWKSLISTDYCIKIITENFSNMWKSSRRTLSNLTFLVPLIPSYNGHLYQFGEYNRMIKAVLGYVYKWYWNNTKNNAFSWILRLQKKLQIQSTIFHSTKFEELIHIDLWASSLLLYAKWHTLWISWSILFPAWFAIFIFVLRSTSICFYVCLQRHCCGGSAKFFFI